jgi:hypothetical protein
MPREYDTVSVNEFGEPVVQHGRYDFLLFLFLAVVACVPWFWGFVAMIRWFVGWLR